MNQKHQEIREAVGIFESETALQEAIDELTISGFERAEMSIIGNEASMQKVFHVKYKDPKQLVDNQKTPRGVNFMPEDEGAAEGAIISVSTLAGVVAALIATGSLTAQSATPAAIIGGVAGTAIGGALANLIGDSHAQQVQKQLEAGGLVLWVRTTHEEKEKIAYDILKKHGASNVHLHTINI